MFQLQTEKQYNQRILKIIPELQIKRFIAHFYLDPLNIHGFPHWLRVAHNGLMLSDHENVSDNIVVLFAFFHDLKRFNDGDDPEHGQRGGDFLNECQHLFKNISKEEIQFSIDACSTHTDGLQTDFKEIALCWDADRLDLYRVGLIPNNFFLTTQTARSDMAKEWANRYSISSFNKKLPFFKEDFKSN